MKIYKISDEPVSSIEKQFEVEVIEPIIGANLSAAQYFQKVLPLYNKTGKLLSPSELGCALSHISVYEKIVESKCGAIIFEADISPTKLELGLAIKKCASTESDFIHLGWHPNVTKGIYFKEVKSATNGMHIVDTQQNFYGAFAYYVSLRMAKELIEYHRVSIKLADSWARFFIHSEITPYFYPVFTHPPVRNSMHIERIAVDQDIHKVSFTNIRFMIKKLLMQKLSVLKFWQKSIMP